MTISDWESKVLRAGGVESLSALESAVPGCQATYPLLGEELLQPGEPEVLNWTTRVVLCKPGQDASLLEGDSTEVAVGGPPDGEPLQSFLQVVKIGNEAFLSVDLNILRNVSEIRRLQQCHEDIDCWVLVTNESVESDPEKLVGETIRLLTGVLSGCRRLEIRQEPGEPISSLRSRLNVARLMVFESELGEVPDPLHGAGLFEELKRRITF